MVETTPPSCDEADIRAQLARILASPQLIRSRRLCKLLQYLVEESLAGRGDKIKATTIAIDVFGRDASFDQQGDPIVRVEAGRLRQRLADYYHSSTDADRILIKIPKGAYRPVFSLREPPAAEAAPQATPSPSHEVATPRRLARQENRWTLVLALFASLVAIGGAVYHFAGEEREATAIAAQDNRPYIVVMPVAANPADEQSARLAQGLVEALITNLSKVSGLSVMAHGSVLEAQQRQQTYGIKELRDEFGVSHLLRCAVEREGENVVLYVQLVDARNARVLWAQRMSRRLEQAYDLREALAIAISAELAVQLEPGERARLAEYHAANTEAWLLYRQGLITIMPPRDLARIKAARQLFERSIELAPEFAGGHAGISFSHSTRALFMNTDKLEEELAMATQYAELAIALDPEFGAGYSMLALAQMLSDEVEAALLSAEISNTIQPGDAFSRFVMGMSLVLGGQSAVAIPHLQEALRLDPLEPRMPYLNVMGIAYYNAGDYTGALATFEQNQARGGPRGPHMDVFIAASLAQLGEEVKAREVFALMRSTYPGFPWKNWLQRWLIDPEQLQKALELLSQPALQAAL